MEYFFVTKSVAMTFRCVFAVREVSCPGYDCSSVVVLRWGGLMINGEVYELRRILGYRFIH